MADTPDVKRLELRIQELENQLKQFQATATPQDLTREEVAAFQKVSSVLSSFDDWGCGINECRPIGVCRSCTVCRICRICRVCRVCDVECICGPCNICMQGGGGGGGGGFSGFGG
jgi:hypothetical protein